MPENETKPVVRKGQRWQSRDPRDHGRTVTVTVAPETSLGHEFVEVCSVRRSRVRVNTLWSRYRLLTAPTHPTPERNER